MYSSRTHDFEKNGNENTANKGSKMGWARIEILAVKSCQNVLSKIPI